MKPFLLSTLLFLIFSSTATYATDSAPLRERMGAEQFKAAGLDKLSATELEQLDHWIQGIKTVVVEKRVEVEKPAEDTSDILSTLVGEFKGWRGNATFTLANGQAWQQTDTSALYASTLINPKVRITHSNLSGWKLQVEGYNSLVRVRRIR